ncbi:MAG TPA: hypothetical protein VFY88_11455 [Intrasporangium sp.]|nr:hypothetical protein [Intrasporangium sp.]
MTKPTPLSQVVADDLLIDRVAGGGPAGDDPIAGLLAALADHADRPLGRARTGRRFRHHRVLSTLAALTIGASGASVAAAVTVPDVPPSAAPSRVASVPHRAGSALGAELVRDATGRVTVIGADGTRVESAWLPDGVGPVLLTPATDRRRALGAEASRDRWEAIGGLTALILAGPEQDPERADPDSADPTRSDGPGNDAGTGPADEAATPTDAAATPVDGPVDGPAAEPSPGETSTATPSDDATPATTPSDDATDQNAGTGESDVAPYEPGTTGSTHAAEPAHPGVPGAGRPSDTENPSAADGSQPYPADQLPSQAPPGPGVSAAEAPIPTAPVETAPADDAGAVAAPTSSVMIAPPTVPVAVEADPS